MGWWFGIHGVNRMIILFFKASISLSSRYSIHPFLQIILVQNIYCSSVQAAATTFAFSFVLILLLYLEPLALYTEWYSNLLSICHTGITEAHGVKKIPILPDQDQDLQQYCSV